MQSIRVAAVSMNGRLGEPERVLGDIAAWCERAAAERADLVLFPELVVHGHCTPNTWTLAEPVPGGPSVQRLIQLARQHRMVLCVGLSEKERDIVYNAQVLVGPDGYIGKQRKVRPEDVLAYAIAVVSQAQSRRRSHVWSRANREGGKRQRSVVASEGSECCSGFGWARSPVCWL